MPIHLGREGSNTANQFLAGLDPTNPASLFRIHFWWWRAGQRSDDHLDEAAGRIHERVAGDRGRRDERLRHEFHRHQQSDYSARERGHDHGLRGCRRKHECAGPVLPRATGSLESFVSGIVGVVLAHDACSREIAAVLEKLGCPGGEVGGDGVRHLDRKARMDAERKGTSYEAALAHLIGLMAQGWARPIPKSTD